MFVATLAIAQPCLSETGDNNPTGVAGIYNGQITTAGNYDPYTGNAMRTVDDIVVPGSLGTYPLKWTRYFNTHVTWQDNRMGGSWRFSYLDYRYPNATNELPCYPDGRRITLGEWGVEEYNDAVAPAGIRMPDGGKIVYASTIPYYYQGQSYNAATQYVYPTQIIDPYGLVTTLTWVAYGNTATKVLIKLDKVTEPGGRYLKINWDATNSFITSVQAFDGVNPQPIQSVNYTWAAFQLSHNWPVVQTLSHVDYSDGTFASYTYTDQAYSGPPICSYPYRPDIWRIADLATADDVRYNGPMRQIAYQYYGGENQTRVATERNLITGEAVSSIAGIPNSNTEQVTETRGDGATRSFYYFKAPACRDCPPPDSEACLRDPIPTDGKLYSYTDFVGNSTTLTYETNQYVPSAGFITAVTDVNGNTTRYTRSNLSWGILKITYPPTPSEPQGSSISQTFTDEAHPHYLASRTDELGRTIIYSRDGLNRITRKDYPTPDATALNPSPSAVYESFTYNKFNQILTHRMTNGGTQYFTYDARGLKTSYTDSLGAGPGDPNHTITYSYYTFGPWADRIQTATYPPNASNARAVETYEYDRAYDANNENSGASIAQAPIAGRGLVTRVTHADGSYQAFGYDKFGNKVWQEDELRHRTTTTYDAYNRVLTIKDPLNRVTTNNYVPIGKTSSWITTSTLPFYTLLPSGKQTTFYYDANWRKTRVQQAPGTSDEASTYFTYDNLGNQLTMKDPRGNVTTNVYDARNRLISNADALNHATTFTYDAHSNQLTVTKPNGEVITNVYDKLNRVTQVKTKRDANTTDVRNSSYDAAGNVIRFQDENATARGDTTNIYAYTYDLRNRITSMIYPNGLHEDTTYDNAGNVVTYKNRANFVKTASQFDNRNRSHRFDWSDGTTWQTTSFDNASRFTQIANGMSSSRIPAITTINNTYLNDNRLSTQEEWTTAFNDNVHRTVSYTYDADGNRLTVQYPSGTALNYNYTNRNQVSSIKPGLSGGTPIVSYTYDSSGNVTTRSLENGTSTAYTVDQVNRDTAVAHSLMGTTRRFDYAYNSVNDILAVQRDSSLGDGYTYDLTQEILGFAQNGAVNLSSGAITNPLTYNALTFDGCGNQKSTSLNGNPGGIFAVDYLNEYNTFNGQAVSNDSNGDVLSYNGWTYNYDPQNRLTSATNGSTTATFYYDGLNRQVARQIGGASGPPPPTPTPTPTSTASPTPAASPTPTPTPTPTPCGRGCGPINAVGGTASADRTGGAHANATINLATQSAWTKSGAVTIGTMFPKHPAESSFLTSQPQGTVTIFSVWDGDWAVLEEYDQNHNLVQGYVQGYHGLVKSLTDNIYYYQDELGSTSHIANASGALIESYQYDLYGKPRVYNSGGVYQSGAIPVAKDLFAGQRWINELALYDDRNRFMSPALGRFIQPDPIGFKGDASSLYRYCGNDWANRTDPMGTDSTEKTSANTKWQQSNRDMLSDHDRGEIFNYGLLNVQRINFRNAQQDMQGFTMGTEHFAPAYAGTASAPSKLSPPKGQVFFGQKQDRLDVRRAIRNVLDTPRGQDFVQKMEEDGRRPTVILNNLRKNEWEGGIVYIDPHSVVPIRTTAGVIPATLERRIAHEFGHAIMHAHDAGPNRMNNVIENENPIMRSLHEPERTEYR